MGVIHLYTDISNNGDIGSRRVDDTTHHQLITRSCDSDSNSSSSSSSIHKPRTTDSFPQGHEGLERELLVGLDCGLGWVIVLAAMLIQCIVDGCCYCYATYIMSQLGALNTGQDSQLNTILLTLPAAVYLLLGPVAGVLVREFGCRKVTVLGSVISCVALLASSYVTSVVPLICLYGVLAGLGFGLMYLPTIVVVSYCFRCHRATATALVLTGSSLSVFTFSQLLPLVEQMYGWAGTLQILAGVVLQGMVCGCVYYPLHTQRKRERERERSVSLISEGYSDTSSMSHIHGRIMRRLAVEKRRVKSSSNGSLDGMIITQDNRFVWPGDVSDPSHLSQCLNTTTTTSAPDSPLLVWRSISLEQGKRETVSGRTHNDGDVNRSLMMIRGSAHNDGDVRECSRSLVMIRSCSLEEKDLTIVRACASVNTLADRCRHLSSSALEIHSKTDFDATLVASSISDDCWVEQCAANSATCANNNAKPAIPATYANNCAILANPAAPNCANAAVNTAQTTDEMYLELSDAEMGDFFNCTQRFCCKTLRTSAHSTTLEIGCDRRTRADSTVYRLMRNIMKSLTLLKALTFIEFCAGALLPFLGYFTPIQFLASYCLNHGYSVEDAQFVHSILLVTSAVGPVLIGRLIDQSCVEVITLYNLSLLGSGLVTCIVPLIHSYELICILAATLGLGIAVFVTLQSLILIELFGLVNLTSALGLLLFFKGLVSLLGSSIPGVILQSSTSFSVAFPVAGLFILVGGALCLPVSRVASWEINRMYSRSSLKPAHSDCIVKPRPLLAL